MTARVDLHVLGKIIGTFTDWDEVELGAFLHYSFEPNELGEKFLPGWKDIVEGEKNLFINYQAGVVEAYRVINDNVIHLIAKWGVFEND